MDTVSSLRQSTVLRASRLHQSKPRKIPRFLNINTISLFTILRVVRPCFFQVMLPLCFGRAFIHCQLGHNTSKCFGCCLIFPQLFFFLHPPFFLLFLILLPFFILGPHLTADFWESASGQTTPLVDAGVSTSKFISELTWNICAKSYHRPVHSNQHPLFTRTALSGQLAVHRIQRASEQVTHWESAARWFWRLSPRPRGEKTSPGFRFIISGNSDAQHSDPRSWVNCLGNWILFRKLSPILRAVDAGFLFACHFLRFCLFFCNLWSVIESYWDVVVVVVVECMSPSHCSKGCCVLMQETSDFSWVICSLCLSLKSIQIIQELYCNEPPPAHKSLSVLSN